jgi:hypothetical protein
VSLKEAIVPVAERIKADIEGQSPSVKAYLWGAGASGLDEVPAGVVQLPKIERTGLDRPEDHLGALDVDLQFEVVFYFDASNVNYSLPQAAETVLNFIDAIDHDITLGGTAVEAKVTSSEAVNVDVGSGRPLFGYSCTVDVETFTT